MKITYDKEADAMNIYLQLKKKIKDTKEVGDNTIIDVAQDGDIVGIEILGVQAQMAKKDLKRFKEEFALA